MVKIKMGTYHKFNSYGLEILVWHCEKMNVCYLLDIKDRNKKVYNKKNTTKYI